MPLSPRSSPSSSPGGARRASPLRARVRARHLAGVLVLGFGPFAGAALAAGAAGGGGDAIGAAIDAERDARDLRPSEAAPQVTPGDATPTARRERITVWNVSLGLASDHDEDDHRLVTTPFALTWQSASDAWWKVQLRGSGFVLETPPGGLSHEGFGNLGLNVFRHVAPGLTVGGGFAAPTDGSVGSHVWSEYARVMVNGDFGPRWSWFGSGTLKHQPRAHDQFSDWTEIGYGQLGYKVDHDDLVGAGLGVGHTGGHKPAATFALIAGFPLGTSRGLFALTQGVSGDQKHTGVRFEVSSDF